MSAANADGLVVKIFLQGGQSNADGRGKTNGLPSSLLQPQPDVPIYYFLVGGTTNADGTSGTLTTLRTGLAYYGPTTFGPELTFGRTLADYYAVSNSVSTNTVIVAMIKYAAGGTSLASKWKANGTTSMYSPPSNDGPNYRVFQGVVRDGLARLSATYPGATLELDGMIWVQGESDIDLGTDACTAYGTNLVQFIKDVRMTFGSYPPYGTNFPFFFSRISTNQTVYSLPSDAGYTNYLLLRASQAYAAANLTNVYMLDIDGSQFTTLDPYVSPGLHFDMGGQKALGTALANLVRTSLPPSSVQSLNRLSTGWRLNVSGVSGTRQYLEWTSSLTGTWTSVTNFVMDSSGSMNYDDMTSRGAVGFYRVRRP